MNNMFYKKGLIYSCLPVLLAIASCFLFSCQKELNGITASSGAGGTGGGTGSGPTTNMKPKLGTKWYYRYYKWNAGGGLNEFHDVTYKANSEDILGGETWLNIIDSLSNITVFLLNEKTGGLYQYINNSANLLCKYPAAVNDTYTADNGFILTDFMVKKVNDTMPFGAIGNLAINYYEGYLSAQPPPPAIVEKIWYNANVWIAQRYYYKKPLLGNFYYRSASLILQDIVY